MNISVDIAVDDFELELTQSLGLSSVRVTPVVFFDVPRGEYRAWDVTFISCAGNVPLMQCNQAGVISLPRRDIICNVNTTVNATSTKLSGNFTIYMDQKSISLDQSSSANEMKVALQTLTTYSVNVTRDDRDVSGEKMWLVTFLVNQGSSPVLSIGSGSESSLSGTEAALSVSEIQEGSFPGGTFSLYFGGGVSGPIEHDATSMILRDAILENEFISDIEVKFLLILRLDYVSALTGDYKLTIVLTLTLTLTIFPTLILNPTLILTLIF